MKPSLVVRLSALAGTVGRALRLQAHGFGGRQPALRVALGALVLAAGLASVLAALALRALQPAPGEWAHRLRIETPLGTLQHEVSVPVLLRWALHPLAALVLDGRSLQTSMGRWRVAYTAIGTVEADCMPCRVQVAALGPEPVEVNRARLLLKRLDPQRWEGELLLGEAARSVHVAWHARLGDQQMDLRFDLPTTPLADAVALFGTTVPEAAHARIDGTLALRLDATWGATGWRVARLSPRIDGARVDGLGTAVLVDAAPPAQCLPVPGGRVQGWLPHALVAAEDQRFHEHGGYDLAEWLAAWQANPGRAGRPLRGGSTLTVQLAKLLFTGDERSATRKLREWLYAVEMERTLGKGRILQTYLAVVPWGSGLCGAEAAARHYLRKPTARLTPREAAWLASLLVNPDREAAQWVQPQAGDVQRVAGIIMAMQRLPLERRESEVQALAGWAPPQPQRPRVLESAMANP